ncbi:hypothetical protein HY256_01485, partial [Candidatus Sumerlaeota bacterium]|nr:hypothetical protein [Candidatus Sumerlaeota bacterium]
PMPPPRVEFSAPGGILSPGGNLLVDLNTVNVRSLNLSATRVYSNNIVAHLQHRGRWCRNYDYEGDLGYQYDDFYDNGSNDRDTSRQILSKEVHLSARANVPKTVALELRDLLKNPLGVYRIRAAANDERWTGDTTLVTVTDLALTAKREKGGMTVWVTRLKSAKPVSGAKVSAVTYTNQTLAAALTGEDGIAHLSFTEDHPDGSPWVVLAELGDDLAYLRPEQRPWLIDDIDQSGREIPKNYDAMLYTERGVYRPGETIHLSGIIREAEGGVPPTFPLRISITRPDGRFVAQLSAKPEENAEGFFHADYTTRPDDQTGVYQFAATLPGATDVLGTAEAKVEAFVPTRIEVKTESPQSLYSGGDKPPILADDRYRPTRRSR